MNVVLKDHELEAMRQLTFYLPAIAQSLQLSGSEVSQKLLTWSSMLQGILDRTEETA